MSLTVNAKTYSLNGLSGNAGNYYGPAHTLSIFDDIRMAYVSPKPNAVFSGVGRTSCKLTRTLTLTGALTTTGQAICDISVSIPVGYTAADVDSILNDMGAFLASATFKTHVKSQQINF